MAAAAAATVSLAAAWGSVSSASAFVAPASAGPPKPPGVAHLDFAAFFPSVTKIHVGDSVSWAINGFHTVTFVPKGQAPPPLIITSTANPISGQLDSIGAALWFNGQPTQIINPQAAAPAGGRTFNGKGLLNSGVPGEGPPKPFVVKFTKAGTFTFDCLVHPGMRGVVKVLPKGGATPSAKQDRQTAAAQEKTAIAQAKVLAKVKPAAATVLAGNDGNGPVTWLRFFPTNLTVKAGTTVEFKISTKREVHTITFGPPAYTSKIEEKFTAPLPGGGGGPPTIGVNPLGGYPSDPPPLPPYTGANHGNGYEGSGILALGGPLPSSTKITFTKAGVYNFECVIHPNMDGKVTVTP